MMSESEATILAVHSGALGDVILFGRLLEALAGPVTLVTGSRKGTLLTGMGVVERSLDFDALPMHEVFAETPLAECALPSLLGPHDRLVSCFAGGHRRAELRLAALCGAADAAFLPIRPDEAADCHLLDVWFDMLGVDSIETEDSWPVPDCWRAERARALAQLAVSVDGGYAVIHPGAGAPDKCWPLENFLALALRMDRAAVFVLGPVEVDRWAGKAIDELRRQVPLAICPPLTTLADMLAGASVFVGNDSGVSHLAAAVGTPTVALFGPTCPKHFAPRGPRATVLFGRPISSISVGAVLDAVAQG